MLGAMEGLSDDEDADERAAAIRDAAAAGNKKKRLSKKADARAEGSVRVKAYKIPIPIEYQESEGGYQKYKLADNTVVYKRHTFTYTDQFKVGDLLAPSDRPAPPVLFCDKYLFAKPKGLLIDPELLKEGEDALAPARKLQRRIEARIQRLSQNLFQRLPLDEPPTAASVVKGNEDIALVFGSRATEWTQKQVMAWAWPSIPLVGDALEHFKTGGISTVVRDTQRVLSLLMLLEDDPTHYVTLTSLPNRFLLLSNTEGLLDAVKLLAKIVRDGMVVKGAEGQPVVRDTLSLFRGYRANYGKDSNGLEDGDMGDGTAARHRKGDPVRFQLFDDAEGGHREITIVGAATDGEEAPTHTLSIDAGAYFLYHLDETKLQGALHRLELIIPSKKRTNSTSKPRKPPGGKTKLARSGRAAMVLLKKVLPEASLAALKKMLAKSADASAAPVISDDKMEIIEPLLANILPGFPFKHPYDSGSSDDEGGGEGDADADGVGEDHHQGE